LAELNESESSPEDDLDRPPSGSSNAQSDVQQVFAAKYSDELEHVVVESSDVSSLRSKGFGSKGLKENDTGFFLYDYEVLYLLYTGKMTLKRGKKQMDFDSFVGFASQRDENAWTRFLIYRDLRTRGYVVREGFGFPIDFRIYARGDYGTKAAKYIVFGLVEGKTIPIRDLKKNIEDMARMGKEAVVAVVERRGEVIYYKVGKWYPIKPI
jgi:tRNA-intron endonuclease, archaea type